MRNVVLTLVGVIVGAFLAVLIFVYSGVYNVAATNEDSALTEWFLETAMENSVASHAEGIPELELSGEEGLVSGASHYDSMCVPCHGAPGRERAEFAAHLNPEPPDFGAEPEEVEEWSAGELFWITKHGIKMTGMPAWGPTHSDEDLWNIVALMKQFPELSAAEYDAFVERAKESGHHHGDKGTPHHETGGTPNQGGEDTPASKEQDSQKEHRPDGGDTGSKSQEHDHSGHSH